VVTFTEQMTFHWNGEAIEVIHIPHAHTDGDAIIIFPKANVIHMGDTFFNGLYPFIDVDTGGSHTGILAAADLALARADENTKILPGHGPVGNRQDLQTYRDMVATYAGRVRAAIDQGKTLEEIKAMKPGKEWDETHGYQFIQVEQMVELVYRDLTGNRH
jgi:glyoxylase-like metal-dependent hydrolase (beta-lactamase superfamily II)